VDIKRYDFSSIYHYRQTTITKDGEAFKITYLHNAADQRVFKNGHRAAH
jgi:hypothetical protein